MAEETLTTAAPDATPATTTEKAAVVSDGPVAEKPESAPVEENKPDDEAAADVYEKKIAASASFKEETNVAGDLPDPENKALDELKQLVREALNKRELSAPPPPPPAPVKEEEKAPVVAEPEATAVPMAEEEKAEKASAPPPAEEAMVPDVAENKGKEIPPHEPVTAEKTPVTVFSEVVTAIVDDDGAKTVEAIEETVVAVTSPEDPAPEAETPKKEVVTVTTPAAEDPPVEPEDVSIWGIPLLADEKSDVVLLKFLRARDFKVKDAFTMLRNTVRWKNKFKIDCLLEEDLGTDLDKVVFISGVDKEGHPVCYNAYGEFQNKELYQSTFADAEKPDKFLRWRVQFLEKTIRKELDFSPDGISTFVQVNDLKASPGLFKRELKIATNQAVQLLQDNYPEFVAKQVFINVPWWYLAFYKMISPFFTQRTKSKFVFAGPSKSAETLFKYIAPEQVPVQYGGLSKDGDQEFTTADTTTEEIIKPSTKATIEFPTAEASTLVWEARVIGWDVSYGAEFVPSAEGGYTVIIQKSSKISPADETILSGSFKAREAGKVELTFDNSASSKKKKLLYRSKTTKPSE